MGSTERPPNALSLRSSEVRFGRNKSDVHSERRDWGISEMSRPVKMSEKSATWWRRRAASQRPSLRAAAVLAATGMNDTGTADVTRRSGRD